MVEVCALASGSNGNCYYIGNAEEAVLIDAGISCKQILLRMEERQLVPAKVKAIFVSHEHIDHIRGVRVLADRLKIPAFFTQGTFQNTTELMRPKLFRFINRGESSILGNINIHCFSKLHDAAEPCSFRVDIQGKSVGVFTDIGFPCEQVIYHLKQTSVLFLETNYDEKMLSNGPYPWHLKKRISSEVGHLSNIQALNLIKTHGSKKLKTIFLSHLSGENNSPEIALNAFNELINQYQIIATSRHQASEVFIF
jgi:phosphoribosyl 1,2-cyclic phosphodiesterase